MAFKATTCACLTGGASALAILIAAAPAWAQDTASAPTAGPATTVDEVIVTAQKREQSLQDVPIAVSAFSAENLEALQIDGGSELLRAIPNVTFSKNNFSMYNFSIRGIGTKAISAASDPAVAVSFNNSPLIRNRLFEQEYLDVNRVEVLRGPQGTLYGRNATGGVVNMIPNLPGPVFEAEVTGELGNYDSRRGQAMINLPVTDTFWVRAAGSFTQRDGFDYNSFNDTHVNNRDLWSTRLSAAWEPSSRFSANLIWEHFEEDDNRSRTGKQLCTRDPGPTTVGTATTLDWEQGRLSQGCLPSSLYDDAAYDVPNGMGLGQVFIASQTGGGFSPSMNALYGAVDWPLDPYAGITQSRDLREISTSFDPTYQAENDVVQLNLEFQISDTLTFHSQTAYAKDDFRSTQDYARYVSNPIFNDSTGLIDSLSNPGDSPISPGGIYTDPQLGASDRMLSLDLSRSDNRQWYQEFRLQSESDGIFNFSIGANYLDFETQDDYFVFNNLFSLIGEYFYNGETVNGIAYGTNRCVDGSLRECVYVDYSPLNNLEGDGHNYFRSKNAVSTRSWAVFGEGYWDLTPDLRMTVGLRYTDDEKVTTPYPSQLLLGTFDPLGYGAATGGNVARGYPAYPDVEQSWNAVTGRAVLDWRVTDDTLLYASYSRGYKGGGTNPPRADLDLSVVQYQPLPETFEPEYVNAFELGAKSTLMDGRLRLNATAFYYDYTDYQVSQIVDRISLNENFDAESYGLELEVLFRPTPNFQIDGNLGLLRTRIGDGEGSIDVMNRTQGNPDWTLVRPWMQVPSNCIAPTDVVETVLNSPLSSFFGINPLAALCAGSPRIGSYDPAFPSSLPFWSFFGVTYNPLTDAPNGGRGFEADLSGNELPNAPRMTANIGAQYTFNLSDWDLTVRGDYYRQSESFFRVYNTEYDRLEAWDNVNLSVTLENLGHDLTIRAYVKNVFDDAPIVDAFTNSDDSMLTTNVFTLDPRLIAFSVSKRF